MSLEADVSARFGAAGDPFRVEASLSVDAGETLVVLGPSGSGKTLLLEAIAGFHDHDGQVHLHGWEVTDAPPEDRGFGFVFQDYALFSHLTVRENVAFGTRYHEDTRDPEALLSAFDVADLADRSPATLSGGEKQRVALARALAVRPDALLLDEPLSALDVPTRRSLRNDLADALADVTGVYVTHDRTTARALADRIAVMRDGEIVQVGPPEAVFSSPATPFVARFVGANVLPGDRFDHPEGQVAIRPEHVAVGAEGPEVVDADARYTGQATVVRVTREDAATRVVLDWDGERVEAFATDPLAVGASVMVGVPDGAVVSLERN